MDVLDFGAGDEPDPRATTTADIRDTEAVDVVADIMDEWPFDADRFDGIVLSHVVEHLSQNDVVHVLRECARVGRVGGWVEVSVPVGVNAANDGDHEGRWTWERPEQYSIADRRGWDPNVPLRLVDRDLNVWLFGPLSALTPLFKILSRTSPAWATYRAGGGEMLARYEVVE